jgi:hypothetical protein
MTAPASRSPCPPVLSLVFAVLAVGWTVIGVLDTATTWRAFQRWQPSEFTVSRYLASEVFGLIRRDLPRRLIKYEGHLQGVAILSGPGLAAVAVATVWQARRRRRDQPRLRRVLATVLVALLLSLPIAGLSAYVSWQCIFVSPKEVFELRLERQAAQEGREPTDDEVARASELGAQFDAWRRESLLHLFQPCQDDVEGPHDNRESAEK